MPIDDFADRDQRAPETSSEKLPTAPKKKQKEGKKSLPLEVNPPSFTEFVQNDTPREITVQVQTNNDQIPELVTFLDPENKNPRSLVSLAMDYSGSVAPVIAKTANTIKEIAKELFGIPNVGQSVLLNVIKIDNTPKRTPFACLDKIQIPDPTMTLNSPIANGIAAMTSAMIQMIKKLRAEGLERTQGVCILTSDGHENQVTPTEYFTIAKSFREMCDRYSVTPIIVGIGKVENLHTANLKVLTKDGVICHMEDLNAQVLAHFIKNVVSQASQTQMGRAVIPKLPPGITSLK